MIADPRAEFFDGIAERWDGWEDLTKLGERLAAGLVEFGIGPDETVLDVGCGTGNLTRAILDKLSNAGRVVAIDIAPRMIEEAERKIKDPRTTFHVADARQIPMPDASCDRAICFSVWPHFEERKAVIKELSRVLRHDGRLHIWHVISKEKVNEIHASAGEAVRHDVLEPAQVTAGLLSGLGFAVTRFVDAERYLVTAVRC